MNLVDCYVIVFRINCKDQFKFKNIKKGDTII